MNNIFVSGDYSENIKYTNDNFLTCINVKIARDGELKYSIDDFTQEDIQKFNIQADDQNIVTVKRDNKIFDDICIASFNGKSVTIQHPDEFISPENVKEFEVGIATNARVQSDDNYTYLVADLMVKDAKAIEVIKNKDIREVSIGYNRKLQRREDGLYQTDIVGNHVAIVDRGRCGESCKVQDSINSNKQEVFNMEKDLAKSVNDSFGSKVMDKILDKLTFSMKLQDEEKKVEKKVEKKEEDGENPMMKRMDALEKKMNDFMSAMKKEKDEASEAKKKKEEDACNGKEVDSDTFASCRIIAPNIIRSKDVVRKSLETYTATEDGLKAFNSVSSVSLDKLDGVALDVALKAVAKLEAGKNEANKSNQSNDGLIVEDAFDKIYKGTF